MVEWSKGEWRIWPKVPEVKAQWGTWPKESRQSSGRLEMKKGADIDADPEAKTTETADQPGTAGL